LEGYLEAHPDQRFEGSAEELARFGDIVDDLWALQHTIALRCDTAILMSAIAAEERLNMRCVYNLHKNVAESIENLSPAEKLLSFRPCLPERTSRAIRSTKRHASFQRGEMRSPTVTLLIGLSSHYDIITLYHPHSINESKVQFLRCSNWCRVTYI
jgi:hypothetical protein